MESKIEEQLEKLGSTTDDAVRRQILRHCKSMLATNDLSPHFLNFLEGVRS
ncbi:MAG: hypothetical protein ACRC62_19790 [Microcoleus sp.]